MSDEYTPTTEEIREYVEVGGEPRPWIKLDEEEKSKEAARVAAFDRWLSQLIREAKAEAWDEGVTAGATWEFADAKSHARGGTAAPRPANPYREVS